jgi:hypothetical protein
MNGQYPDMIIYKKGD